MILIYLLVLILSSATLLVVIGSWLGEWLSENLFDLVVHIIFMATLLSISLIGIARSIQEILQWLG